MEQRVQLKRDIIEYVLNKQRFYMLPLTKLKEFLKLLEKNQTKNPNLILDYVFIGLMQMYTKFKQFFLNTRNNAATYIYHNQKFSSVSNEVKQLLLSILAQIHQRQTLQQTNNSKVGNGAMNFSVPYYYQNPYIPNFLSPNSQNYTRAMEQLKKYHQAISRMNPYYTLNPTNNNSLMYMNYLNQMSPNMFYGQGKANIPDLNKIPYSFNGGFNLPQNSFDNGSGGLYPNPYYNMYNTINPQMTKYQVNNQFATQSAQNGDKLSPFFTQKSNTTQNQQKQYNNITHIDKQTFSKRSSQVGPGREKNLELNLSDFLPNKSKNNQKNLPNRKTNSKTNEESRLFAGNKFQFLPQKVPQFKDARILLQANKKFLNCPCQGFFNYEDSFTCVECKNSFHLKCFCILDKSLITPDQQRCPLCLVKMLDPLNKVDKILCEKYIMNISQKPFHRMVDFKQIQSLLKDKGSKYDVQFRCIRTDNLKDLQISWPDQVQIKINGGFAHEFNALQTNSSLKKRRDYPLVMTHQILNRNKPFDSINLPENTKVTLEIKNLSPQDLSKKRIKNNCTFAFGIYLVEKLNCDQLSTKIISQDHVKNPNFLDKLLESEQNQIEIDKITIKLTDPFSWELIKTPVRGAKCTHAQCFDLKTFVSLMYSSKQRTWKCPLCSKDARTFMIDEKQMSIIKQVEQMSQVPQQISIYKGSKIEYKVMEESQESQSNSKMPKKSKKIQKQSKIVKNENPSQSQKYVSL